MKGSAGSPPDSTAIVTVPTDLRWFAVLFTAVVLAGAVYGWRAERPSQRLVGLFLMAAGGHALYAVDPQSPGWLPERTTPR